MEVNIELLNEVASRLKDENKELFASLIEGMSEEWLNKNKDNLYGLAYILLEEEE